MSISYPFLSYLWI